MASQGTSSLFSLCSPPLRPARKPYARPRCSTTTPRTSPEKLAVANSLEKSKSCSSAGGGEGGGGSRSAVGGGGDCEGVMAKARQQQAAVIEDVGMWPWYSHYAARRHVTR